MGTNSAPLLADLFLHTFEYDFMVKTMKQDITKAIQFSNTFRYIDDLFSINNVNFGNCISAIYPSELELMRLSMVCPRMGGPGNPRELDFVKRTWVGILTSTTVPRVGNLTRPPSWKVERNWEWVSGPPSWKIPRSHLSEFPASKDGWKKVRIIVLLFLKQNVVFYAHQCSVFKALIT